MKPLGQGFGKQGCLSIAVVLAGLCVSPMSRAEQRSVEQINLESARQWAETIAQFQRRDRQNTFPTDAVLFVGSSSIAFWPTKALFPEFPVINRGFGGSIYSDLIHYAEAVIFPYKPRVIVFYSGDNDPIWGKNAVQIAEDVRRLVGLVHQHLPRTQIILMAVKISQARIDRAEVYTAFNAMLKAMADEDDRLHYFDSASLLLDEQGRPDPRYFVDDKLHLNEEGYRVWSDHLRPLIAQLMAEPAAERDERAFFVAPDGDDGADGTDIQSPLRTLKGAFDRVRRLAKDKPVTVYLRDGTYCLTEPVVVGPEHSGTAACPVTIRPYDDGQPLITGGRRVTGWQRHDANIWKTDIAEVKAGTWYFTQLFVNGQRRLRARTPNEGFFRVAGFPDGGSTKPYNTPCQRFEFRPGDLSAEWTNLTDAEVIVYHFWTDTHLPIAGIDAENHVVSFQYPSGKRFTDDYTSDGARYIVENVSEALDAPGEWYLNRRTGVLYYWPKADEDMQRAEVVAPIAPALLRLQGDPLGRRYVEHLRFEGIRWAHTQWQLPPGDCNNAQASSTVPAAVSLQGARNVHFDRCVFEHIGTYAVEVLDGCRDNRFTRNEIVDVAGGGFRVNGGDVHSHPLLRTGGTLIADNCIGPYGQGFFSSVGVLLMHTDGNTVEHNEIHHGYYTGVSVGWSWGYQRSVSRDNRIAFNHIHHIGQGLLSDMGGIYTLGVSPGTVLAGNRIHDVQANRYGGWGIYNDEGSSHILVEDNVVYDTHFAGYNIHYAKEITVRNNIFAFGRIEQLSRSIIEPHKSCFFENNIVYFTQGHLLNNQWGDRPYEFYYQPRQGGTRTTASTFDMDWNVYFNPAVSLQEARFNGKTFEDWQKGGKDLHSRWVDPLFIDPAQRDFRLRPHSPALELGFRPLEPDRAGPREWAANAH